jgi:hypothetical protein
LGVQKRLGVGGAAVEGGTRLEPGRDPPHGVQDGGVVATELARDLGEGETAELARHVHGEVAGPRDLRGAGGGAWLGSREANV